MADVEFYPPESCVFLDVWFAVTIRRMTCRWRQQYFVFVGLPLPHFTPPLPRPPPPSSSLRNSWSTLVVGGQLWERGGVSNWKRGSWIYFRRGRIYLYPLTDSTGLSLLLRITPAVTSGGYTDLLPDCHEINIRPSQHGVPQVKSIISACNFPFFPTNFY